MGRWQTGDDWRKYHGNGKKEAGGTMARFLGTSHHADKEAAALRDDHPAIVNGTTLFPKSVRTAATSPRLLVSGVNNAKTGGKVTKGPWAGCAIYTLSLVERETCPICPTILTCYGNAMPLARRHRPDDGFYKRLNDEVAALLHKHGRIALRLHVLGDFFSRSYVEWWRCQLGLNRGLHIWGYTSRNWDTDHGPEGAIFDAILEMNKQFPRRCSIRASMADDPDAIAEDQYGRGMQTAIIWRQPEGPTVPEGRVCPASMERTAACGTCGLCWSPEMRKERIVFVGHGLNRRRKNNDASQR